MRTLPSIHLHFKNRTMSFKPYNNNIFSFIACSFLFMVGFFVLLPLILCGKVRRGE